MTSALWSEEWVVLEKRLSLDGWQWELGLLCGHSWDAAELHSQRQQPSPWRGVAVLRYGASRRDGVTGPARELEWVSSGLAALLGRK